MIRFAISNAFRRKGIVLLAVLGTGLGCALMTVLLSLSDGMDRRLTQTMNQLTGNILVSSRDASAAASILGGGTPLPAAYVKKMEELDHVKAVLPTVSATIPRQALKALNPLGVPFAGIDASKTKDADVPTKHIVDGRTFEKENEVIVGSHLKSNAALAGTDLKIGYRFTVSQERSGEPLELVVVGTFETGNMIYDSSMYGSINTARKILGMPEERVSSIRVEVDDTGNVNSVAEAVERSFAEDEIPVSVFISRDILRQVDQTMDVFRVFLLAISVMAAVAGGMSIFIIMLMSVMERMREFGIFKACGWSNQNIITSVVNESITVALIGACFGFLLGLAATLIIDHYLGEEIAIVTATLTLKVVAFGVIVGVVGGLYPAVKAAQVSPMKSLRSL